MPKYKQPGDEKERARIRHHYEVEKELAGRLRNSEKAERARLYTELYDELFRKVPHHPQLAAKAEPGARRTTARKSLRLLGGLLGPGTVFLELGPGDCALSVEAARKAGRVYAVDVSEELTGDVALPGNVEVIISHSGSIHLPDGQVDVAYSNQLMEHLHPDDALEQLREVHRVLKSGGSYYCITPNRLTGPHDVSAYFDDVATGFHLKEYTNTELREMFIDAGFRDVRSYVGKQGLYLRFPLAAKLACERALGHARGRIGRLLVRSAAVRLMLRIIMVGVK